MKRVFLLLMLALVGGTGNLFAQETNDLAIAPFEFTASTPKEITQNIKEIIAYSKSISSQFNQRVKGNLLLNTEENIQIAELDTKFDGKIELSGNDYSTIADFLKTDFTKEQDYYFVPQHDAPAWYECKINGNVWVDLNVVKIKGINNFIYRFYIPEKSAAGLPYEAEYPVASIMLNDKPLPLAKGNKNYGVITRAVLFSDTIKTDGDLIRVEIKVKGLGKPFKLMYLDKSKGEDFSKNAIEGFQFYNLPAKAIVEDSLFFSMSRVGVCPLKPEQKYQVCIVMTLSNGKECPLKKKDKFIVQPIITEYKTGRVDTLKKRTISNRSGSIIYRQLIDIPLGTSAVQFNYEAHIACKNGTDDNKGHVNACSVFVFREDE